MPITDTQLKLIREEAEMLYPTVLIEERGIMDIDEMHDHNFSAETMRNAHIQCATLYQEKLNLADEKAKVLVEALQRALKKDGYQYLKDAIDTYNKTINNG